MELRKSTQEDIVKIMTIINEAQKQLKDQGVDQWQNNYPNLDTINDDIRNNTSYVLMENEEIVATVVISFDGEKTYDNIYDGKWITNNEYAVIHRLAVKDSYKGKGIASKVINCVEERCLEKNIHSIKIDTHMDNKSMQRLLKKCGFEYCGIIYLEDGNKRIAFEKII